MAPEFMCDALDDLADFYAEQAPVPPVVGPLHPAMARVWSNVQRLRGVSAPEHGGCLDTGFLLVCDKMAQGLGKPGLFGDLVAWRMGGTVTADPRAAYSTTPEQGRKVKSFAIAAGVRKPTHRRLTRAEQLAETDRRFGLRP